LSDKLFNKPVLAHGFHEFKLDVANPDHLSCHVIFRRGYYFTPKAAQKGSYRMGALRQIQNGNPYFQNSYDHAFGSFAVVRLKRQR
jgi:hypothetical protein